MCNYIKCEISLNRNERWKFEKKKWCSASLSGVRSPPEPEPLENQSWKFVFTQNGNKAALPFDSLRSNPSEYIRCAVRICQTNKLIKLQFIDHAKFDTHQFKPIAFGNLKNLSRLFNNQSTSFILFYSLSYILVGWKRAAETQAANSQIN